MPQDEFEDLQSDRTPAGGLINADQIFNPPTVRGFVAFVGGILVLLFGASTDRLVTIIAVVLMAISAVDFYFEFRSSRKQPTRFVQIVIGFGIGATLLVWPDATTRVLALGVGGYLILSGLAESWKALRDRETSLWGWPLLRGLVMITLGVVVLASGDELLALIVFVVAVTWAAAGMFTVVTNLRADKPDELEVSDTLEIFLRWLDERKYTSQERRELYQKIFFEGSDTIRRVSRFFMLMAFATAIATLGVIQDSTAVVIGAMLIAPLMTPLMGTAASLIMGWPNRAARAALVSAGGILLAIGFAFLVAEFVPELINADTNSQIVARVSPNLVDLMIALAAGGAGAFALSRPDVADALPGVAVAIALVPPLTVVGITFSIGERDDALGALLLFTTNAVAILLAGALVFLLTGFTPLRQVIANREWIGRVFTTVGIAALVIFGLLAASSTELTFNLSTVDKANTIVEGWAQAQDSQAISVTVSGNEVTATVAGPTQPTGIEQLADQLAAELGFEEVMVTVDWFARDQLKATSGG